ncbi:MAG: DUF6111 family protein [Devosia sp.]
MIRVVITQIVLFLLPFVVFLVYRLATRGPAGARFTDLGPARFTLTLIGGALVVAGFIYFAISGSERTGVYVPAQYKDGELVPGGFRSE